jgi:peroxiredoxin
MKQVRLEIGNPAPDFALQSADAAPVSLSGIWADGPTVLTFLRHFG